MKKLFVPLLILTCFFSSPNFGTLFNTSAWELFSGTASVEPLSGTVLKSSCTETQLAVLKEVHKKARLPKRALFALPLTDPIIFSLFSFCLALPFFQAVVSRKPFFVHLRSPPRF